ncbi:MAG: hypothetical protein H0T89_20645 [Deltaproteobacteria bacterium]|nr:hypothetical protein [Deltaproteobacteria bacterium]MDQ3295550.1 hypothetical protein [Myxococcota bacterium]
MNRRPLGYLDGVGAGVATIAIAIACYLAAASFRLRRVYEDFGEIQMPASTHIVLSAQWVYGMPLALLVALIALHIRRPRWGLVVLAVVAIAVNVFWYVSAWAPVFGLAGNVSSQ